MTTLEQLKAKRNEIYSLADKYHVGNIRVFGSVVHNEDTVNSDVDFLFDPKPGFDLWGFGGLQMDLSDLIGKKADVILEESLHWFIKDRILKEAKPL